MKNGDLKKWAMIAEVFSGIAVIITLFVLIIEMRDNTRATQAQTYQLLMQEMNDFRSLFADPDLAAITIKANEEGVESLSSVERLQLNTTASMRWGFYESAFYANKSGVLGDQEWQRFERAYCRAVKQTSALWSAEVSISIQQQLTEEFVNFVEESCGVQ